MNRHGPFLKMSAKDSALMFIYAFMDADKEGREKLARWWNADVGRRENNR